MLYLYEIGDGRAWRIEHSTPSNRWVLSWREGNRWRNVASHANPGSAALAVANGDTGLTEWDESSRDPASFALQNWMGRESPPAVMRSLGSVNE